MNRFHFHLEVCIFKQVLILLCRLIPAITLLLLPTICVVGQEPAQNPSEIPFEDRLRYYLNDKTQDVVKDLLAQEQQLLQLVQNIHLEVAARGSSGLAVDQAGFHEVYDRRDTLIQSYQQELTRLIDVYDDLQKLQRVADYKGDHRLLEQVAQTRNDLLRSVDDRGLYKKGVYTSQRVGGMLDDYTGELDSLLNIYDALERARVLAQAQQDTAALQTIDRQQTQLFKVLGTWNKLGPMADTSFLRLRNEAQSVSQVMKQIDSLQSGSSANEALRLEAVKSALFNRVDKTVIDLLTEAGYSLNAYPTVSDFIDTWKKERLIDIKTRLTEYQVIQKRLIETATDAQRDRMLSRDLSTLAINFSNGKYRPAEYQIENVKEQYHAYYSYFVPLTYYLAECRYHRKAYDAARDLYLEVAADSSAGRYRAASFVRLMQYANTYDLQRDFLTSYSKLQKEKQAGAQQLELAHYLAANRFFSKDDLTACRTAIMAIPPSSSFHMPAQLLLAIVYLNQNDFVKAVPVLRTLADETSYPWTDLQTAYIRNTALLKLGMIYYQRGEFQNALSYFDRVSQGFENYDQALIGQAWANLRMGDYDGTLAYSRQLLNNYLASNFTYEALTLSGHCKRLLNQPESALNAYRYVVRSQKEKESKKDFNPERDRVLAQDRELNRMEKESLEKKQVALYSEIDKIKDQITGYMDVINERTGSGTQLLQDYYDERMDIFARLDDLQTVIEVAEREERPDLADQARRQLSRLVRVLETYHSDQDVVNTAFLIEFPLAAKEASQEYQQTNLSNVYRDLELEKRRLERNAELLTEYKRVNLVKGGESDRNDLDILQGDLQHLRDRLSVLRKGVVEARPDAPASNAELWNDLSGFGMTDIIFKERGNRLNTIDDYANRLKGIETVLADRRGDIEQRLQGFENDIRKLSDTLLSRKIKLEQMERQTYFEKFYFDEKEQEEEAWEERLNKSQNP
jgi:hypothetical protein